MKRTSVLIASAVTVLVCGACAPRAGTAPAAPLTAAAVDLVTDSGTRPGRKVLTATAEEEVTRRCMAGWGEPYRPYVPPLATGDDEHRLIDLPKRRARGYELSRPAEQPAAVPGTDRASYHQALFGDSARDLTLTLPDRSTLSFPSTGCIAQARAALYSDVLRWARVDSVPQILGNRLRGQVSSDPSLAAATHRWADCMRSNGFPYASPAAAREAAGVPAREVAIAVADGECDLRAHLTGTELALRRRAAAGLPADDRRELNELAVIDCAATTAAAGILIRPVPPC
ncbi:hypothetical protein KOI35_31770 [Actinoplanes bogorensis]|uniref:Lipoprotein n=1 Tax=Paractinoplanes bogorensis TaxID=1610840 RepID=A0ABS5YXC5_9ACTN|nr:hypothetical protein [Actinoplanes bogorensis]MBU2668098.1 hypothetical protein [Actinoplanes bogorensis]